MIFGNPLNEHFHKEKIGLLPSYWPDGKISGLKALGNIEVSIEWKNEKLIYATLIAQKTKMFCLISKDKH